MTAGGAGGAGAGGLARSLERLLEEAALSGELRLAGRKLRALPPAHPHHAAALRDTTRADLSKNRFSEFPEEITTYLYLEKLLLAQNVIRHVPEAVGALHSLTYLDLSCNQLTELPREICQIPLEVLLLSENRLTSLPKEIGKMAALAELDASHNCIAQVPLTIGDVSTLKALNLSNNQLGLLPLQITYLKLEWLDVSCNCISSLPLELRNMTSLVTLSLDNNPLVSPPTTVCMRGRVHIFKYLESMASKDSAAGHRRAEDTRRATKHTSYVSSTAQGAAHQIVSGNATIDCLRHRARRVDSGYSTSDAADKRSSSDVCGDGGGGMLECSAGSVPGSGRSTPSTPSTLSPGAALSRAHSLSGESPLVPLTPQLSGMRISPEGGAASNGDDKAKLSHQQTYRQYKEALRQQRQQDVYRPRTDQPSPELDSSPQSQSPVHKLSHSTPHSPVANGHYTILSNSSVYSRSTSSNSTLNGTSSTPNTSQMPNSPLLHSTPRRYQTSVPQATLSNGNGLPDTKPEELQNKRPVQKVVPSRNVNKMYTNTIINGNVEYQNGRIPTSGSMPRIRSSNSPDGDVYVKPVSPIKSPTFSVPPNNVRSGISSRHGAGGDAKLLTTSVAYVKGAIVKGPAGNGSRISWNKEVPPDKLSFTMKREFDKQKEELDLLQQLRSIIESRLKMSLPTELAPVLADGVVLCHLANHVRPRAVASVHVPSPAQPKLTMARCRRNVDNFLEACRKMGVEEKLMCCAADVLEGKGTVQVAVTVTELLRRHASPARRARTSPAGPVAPAALAPPT